MTPDEPPAAPVATSGSRPAIARSCRHRCRRTRPFAWRASCKSCSPGPTGRSGGWTARSRRCRTPISSSSCTCARRRCSRARSRGRRARSQDLLAAEAQRPRSGSAARCGRGGQLRRRHEPRARAAAATLPVSVRLIREIHERLLHGVRGSHRTPGELRANPELDRSRRLHAGRGDVRAAAAARRARTRWVSWRRSCTTRTPLPLLVKIGLAHAQFETIHPFLDGNGRVGRLLITFLFCERGAAEAGVVSVSLLQAPPPAVLRSPAGGPRPGRLGGVARLLPARRRRGQRQATETARRILLLREDHRRSITRALAAPPATATACWNRSSTGRLSR